MSEAKTMTPEQRKHFEYVRDEMHGEAQPAVALEHEWLRGECVKCGASIERQEPVTVLPDGSAFAVMSYPLPKDHWLYAERQYEGDADEPNELGKPILTHALRDAVVSAVRYAIRGATNCGKELDFDPDALVQNAVYALCGPYGLAESKNPEQEPVAWESILGAVARGWCYEENANKTMDSELAVAIAKEVQALYTTPPQRTWVGLTDEDKKEYVAKDFGGNRLDAMDWAEKRLKEKNT